MIIRNRDKEQFADFMTNRFNEDYEYNSKQKEIDTRDFRVERPRMVDITARYNEFKSFEKSDSYRNTQIATNLLSPKFDITTDQLKSTLQSKYQLTTDECNEVLQNMANSHQVDMHVNSYDPHRTVKLRRR